MSSMDDMEPTPQVIEDAPRTGRRSSRSDRIEVITGGEGRRVWTLDQKRDVVLASLQPGIRPSDVARLHRISSGQLYTWRRQVLEGQPGGTPRPAPRFTRVEIAASQPALEPPVGVGLSDTDNANAAPPSKPPPLRPSRPSSSPTGLIEIMLPGGTSLRVDSQVDGQALRQVLAALESR